MSMNAPALPNIDYTIKQFLFRLWGQRVAETEFVVISGQTVTLETAAVSSTTSTTIVHTDPWDEHVFGRFNNDPDWADFPRWLSEQYRINDPNNPQD